MHVEHPFALHVETLARRRQQLDLRCALDDFPEQVRAVDQVLEVVEHEQRRALTQVVKELFLCEKPMWAPSTANWIDSAIAGARNSGDATETSGTKCTPCG